MIEIEIKNWDARQERSNRNNYTWFKFYSDFFNDPKVFHWSVETKLVFLFVLCERNKSKKSTVLVNGALASVCIGISESKILKCIEDLISYGVVMSTSSRHDAGVMASLERERERKRERVEQESGLAPPGSKLPPLAEVWNSEIRNPLAKVRAASKARRRHAEARWAENPRPEFWVEVIQRLNKSSFCRGENTRGWKADFDFLVKPDSASRILEGKYDDRKTNGVLTRTPLNVDDIERMARGGV